MLWTHDGTRVYNGLWVAEGLGVVCPASWSCRVCVSERTRRRARSQGARKPGHKSDHEPDRDPD
jgi:hypothetical protein